MSPDRVVPIAALLLGLAALIAFALSPTPEGASLFRIELTGSCSFRAATGHPCPHCGTTRALLHATQGELFAALRHNAGATTAWLAALAAGPWGVLRLARPGPVPSPTAIAIAGAVWVLLIHLGGWLLKLI